MQMPLLYRLRYALYLTVATFMVVLLAGSIASADSVALISSAKFDALLSSPAFYAAMFAVWFALSPWIAARLPIKRDWQ